MWAEVHCPDPVTPIDAASHNCVQFHHFLIQRRKPPPRTISSARSTSSRPLTLCRFRFSNFQAFPIIS
jgi:hypothetical protein